MHQMCGISGAAEASSEVPKPILLHLRACEAARAAAAHGSSAQDADTASAGDAGSPETPASA